MSLHLQSGCKIFITYSGHSLGSGSANERRRYIVTPSLIGPAHMQMIPDNRGRCNIGYLSETHLGLKSLEISHVHNTQFSCQIILKSCTEHGSIIAMLCAKFQNDWNNEQYFMANKVLTRFEFKMSFQGMYSILQHPQGPLLPTWVNFNPSIDK